MAAGEQPEDRGPDSKGWLGPASFPARPPALPPPVQATVPESASQAFPVSPPPTLVGAIPGVSTSPASEYEPPDDEDYGPAEWWELLLPLASAWSWLLSLVVHLAAMIFLGLLGTAPVRRSDDAEGTTIWSDSPETYSTVVEPPLESFVLPEREEPELPTVRLELSVAPATEVAFGDASLQPSGLRSGGGGAADVAPTEGTGIGLDLPGWDFGGPSLATGQGLSFVPSREQLRSKGVLRGAPQASRAIVDNYAQALDRLTMEILRLLEDRELLLIWCFDQSESMKDDQREIRDRIERVYAELSVAGVTSNEALATAVTSFGIGFQVHTPKPVTELAAIRKAIDAVPIDPSGEELMCRAVSQSLTTFQQAAVSQNRQLALVLVTDESGNRQEHAQYLEATVAQARAAHCRVYVLGREAVFGYPYAQVRWEDPQTHQIHWLQVDRGPETALVEQLQTEGFEARTDAHPSGFGPYEQSRLAWLTGGLFFMLPTVESSVVRGENRRYDLELLRRYQPDLRARTEIQADVKRSQFRTMLMKIINDLDPYRPELADVMRMRTSLPADPTKFLRSVEEARGKAEFYYAGLQRASEALDGLEAAREREPAVRWQANYDLMHAQVVAYAARAHLYRKALNEARRKFDQTPPYLPSDERLVGWRVHRAQGLPLDETASQLIDRSQGLYLVVIKNHPGTPWAARADWELKRDFGVSGAALLALTGSAGAEANQTEGASLALAQSATGRNGGGGGGGGAGIAGYAGIEFVADYRKPVPQGGRGGGGGRPSGGGATPQPPPKL
ncbi:MAG: VWA domain-containing protein [Planctomycetota bacterium]|nr:VWA domain-containing protein [Planctomycetota bacterium]